MVEWPSIPALALRGENPTPESALTVLQGLYVSDGELVAISPKLLNTYIEAYELGDAKLPITKLKRTKKFGCRSSYHKVPCDKKAIWTRSLCANCEVLEYNWERGKWPRLKVLHRHCSKQLTSIIRLHMTTELYFRLISLLMGHSISLQTDQLPLRLFKTKITDRQLIPVLGLEGVKDTRELRRGKYSELLSQRVTSLVSLGYAKATGIRIRTGRVFGTLLHVIGPYMVTDTYKRIIEVALREPFLLVQAAPFKTAESAEYLSHDQVLKKLLNNESIHGSLTTCTRGHLTNLDTRGTVFIDLIHCAAHNPAAVLQPINALHFSPDPSQQALLEQERRQPWQVTEKPNPVLQLLFAVNGKKTRHGTQQSFTVSV